MFEWRLGPYRNAACLRWLIVVSFAAYVALVALSWVAYLKIGPGNFPDEQAGKPWYATIDFLRKSPASLLPSLIVGAFIAKGIPRVLSVLTVDTSERIASKTYDRTLGRKDFTARQRRYANKLLLWIDSARRNQPRVLILYGSAGSGKSSMLDCMIHEYGHRVAGIRLEDIWTFSWHEWEGVGGEARMDEALRPAFENSFRQTLVMIHDAERALSSPRQRLRFDRLLGEYVRRENDVRLVLSVRPDPAAPQRPPDPPAEVAGFRAMLRGRGFWEHRRLFRRIGRAEFRVDPLPDDLLTPTLLGNPVRTRSTNPWLERSAAMVARKFEWHPLVISLLGDVGSVRNAQSSQRSLDDWRAKVGDPKWSGPRTSVEEFCRDSFGTLCRDLIDSDKRVLADYLARACVETRGGYVFVERPDDSGTKDDERGDDCPPDPRFFRPSAQRRKGELTYRLRHPRAARTYQVLRADRPDLLAEAHRKQAERFAVEEKNEFLWARHRVRTLAIDAEIRESRPSADELTRIAAVLDAYQAREGERHPMGLAQARTEFAMLLLLGGKGTVCPIVTAEIAEKILSEDLLRRLGLDDYRLVSALDFERWPAAERKGLDAESGRLFVWNALKLCQTLYEALDAWDVATALSEALSKHIEHIDCWLVDDRPDLHFATAMMHTIMVAENDSPEKALEMLRSLGKLPPSDLDHELQDALGAARERLTDHLDDFKRFRIGADFQDAGRSGGDRPPRRLDAKLERAFAAIHVYLSTATARGEGPVGASVEAAMVALLDDDRTIPSAVSVGESREVLYVKAFACALLASNLAPTSDALGGRSPVAEFERQIEEARELLRGVSDLWLDHHLRMSELIHAVSLFLQPKSRLRAEAGFERQILLDRIDDLAGLLGETQEKTWWDLINLDLLRLQLLRGTAGLAWERALARLDQRLRERPLGELDSVQTFLLAGLARNPKKIAGGSKERQERFLDTLRKLPPPAEADPALAVLLKCIRAERGSELRDSSLDESCATVMAACRRLFHGWDTDDGVYVARREAVFYRVLPPSLVVLPSGRIGVMATPQADLGVRASSDEAKRHPPSSPAHA